MIRLFYSFKKKSMPYCVVVCYFMVSLYIGLFGHIISSNKVVAAYGWKDSAGWVYYVRPVVSAIVTVGSSFYEVSMFPLKTNNPSRRSQ
jgi:TRAP-type C4-dicarboxylate transport system permease small subunit